MRKPGKRESDSMIRGSEKEQNIQTRKRRDVIKHDPWKPCRLGQGGRVAEGARREAIYERAEVEEQLGQNRFRAKLKCLEDGVRRKDMTLRAQMAGGGGGGGYGGGEYACSGASVAVSESPDEARGW